ncbi:ABC transporter ATP-binding protein [Acetomicrobium hydrogeniformans]|uniref:ABC transporter ATP-binding protein n=1 Tax=Acetomicrobium hydrogeniformans TaxID=649746 RepID=UPI000716B724|nr:ABC transporter ATP-binding protein [Acetomicrobium hydrogeniformans]
MLKVCGITKIYPNLTVFRNINFSTERGSFAVFLGPSGCGKSTLFRVIAGIERKDSGHIEWKGEKVSDLKDETAMMLQKDLLLPWSTLLDNVLIPAKVLGKDLQRERNKAIDLLSRFGLSGFEDYFPYQVSGGMRQRAALVRTLLFDREILLLDEPLSALDALTRRLLQKEILRIQLEFEKTVLMITHDIKEALFLADRIFLLSHLPTGIIKEIDMRDMPKPRQNLGPKLAAMEEEIFSILRGELVDA